MKLLGRLLPVPEGRCNFDIWSEGYSCTGEAAGAHRHGEQQANTFQEACDKFFIAEKHNGYYDRKHLTYWGCQLFDNEAQARRGFG